MHVVQRDPQLTQSVPTNDVDGGHTHLGPLITPLLIAHTLHKRGVQLAQDRSQ